METYTRVPGSAEQAMCSRVGVTVVSPEKPLCEGVKVKSKLQCGAQRCRNCGSSQEGSCKHGEK